MMVSRSLRPSSGTSFAGPSSYSFESCQLGFPQTGNLVTTDPNCWIDEIGHLSLVLLRRGDALVYYFPEQCRFR